MLWVKLGSGFAFLAVALGAFGAHALKSRLTEYSLDIYKTAVLYHLVHALGLCVVGWLSTLTPDPKINLAGIFMTLGIVLFSGSLYLLAISQSKWLGAITPLGGLSFLVSWALIIFIRFPK